MAKQGANNRAYAVAFFADWCAARDILDYVWVSQYLYFACPYMRDYALTWQYTFPYVIERSRLPEIISPRLACCCATNRGLGKTIFIDLFRICRVIRKFLPNMYQWVTAWLMSRRKTVETRETRTDQCEQEHIFRLYHSSRWMTLKMSYLLVVNEYQFLIFKKQMVVCINELIRTVVSTQNCTESAIQLNNI